MKHFYQKALLTIGIIIVCFIYAYFGAQWLKNLPSFLHDDMFGWGVAIWIAVSTYLALLSPILAPFAVFTFYRRDAK